MNIKINGKEYLGKAGETLMELAQRNHIDIPGLCHKKGFEGQARCRLCIVEVKDGSRTKVVTSCVYPIKEGIEVTTNSAQIQKLRKNIIRLLLLRTPNNPYIQNLAKEYGIEEPKRYLDLEKKEDCILCGLCVKACEKIGSHAISMVNRGITKKVSTPYDDPSKDCIGCGACAEVCPTDAISLIDHNGKRKIWNRAFDLLECSHCGKYFTTVEEYQYINAMLDTDGKEEEPTCETCKKKIMSRKFKEAYQNI